MLESACFVCLPRKITIFSFLTNQPQMEIPKCTAIHKKSSIGREDLCVDLEFRVESNKVISSNNGHRGEKQSGEMFLLSPTRLVNELLVFWSDFGGEFLYKNRNIITSLSVLLSSYVLWRIWRRSVAHGKFELIRYLLDVRVFQSSTSRCERIKVCTRVARREANFRPDHLFEMLFVDFTN